MEKIESLLNIYEQLCYCTNPDEVEKLGQSLNRSNIQLKEVEKDIDRDFYKKDGGKKLGIRNIGKSRISSVADKSREVESLIKEAKRLVEIGNFVHDLTIEVPGEIQVKFPTSDLVGEKFESHKNWISDLLINYNVSIIGVWGMGGVGKTTLVMHLHNMMLTQPNIYGFVYWITVSKDCTIQKLQNDIANRIGESISDKVDESQRAGLLAEALKRKKKFVLVLDDMWSPYDLNKVGLGSPKEIGYQLILTSRSKNVCLRMHCDPIIKVEPLSPEDAWTLFVKNIGHEIPDNLTEISTDVLRECAGLPLGIITLAKCMIGCIDIYEWRNVLNELRNPSFRVDEMEEEVFKVLRLSYDRLKDDQIKKCLLYCATYPEDYEIEMNELVWLFIDAGLLGKNVEITKMFDKGLVILKNLESAALLSIKLNYLFTEFRRDGSMRCEEVVVLHDSIRDMALKIAGSRFMIKARSGLKGVPSEEIWTNGLKVVSLMENEIEQISNFSPKCNRLLMLLLQRNYSLGCVSDGFFRYLHWLKHLDLSWSCITTLPESISQLKILTSLILRHCNKLIKLPSLAELTSLERLDLYNTDVIQLPKGIENLVKLRYLNLDCTMVERIGVGVISKLTALQYLAIEAAFDIEELKSLNNLEHLTIFFEDFDSFSKFSTQMKIKGRPNSYSFRFGANFGNDCEDLTTNWQSKKHIFLTMSLSYDKKMNQISDAGGRRREPSDLWKTSEMERTLKLICEDVNMLSIESEADLRSLADFVLDSAPNLQRQYGIKRGLKPFVKLETLIIERCSNMKKMFPLGLLKNLQNIQDMRIFSCEGLEALIEEVDDETKVGGTGHPQNFSLPKLKRILLDDLPILDILWSNNKVIHTPSLQWISISGCPKLKRMPFVVDNQHQPFPQMRYPKSDEKWIESLEWDPPESKSKITFISMPFW